MFVDSLWVHLRPFVKLLFYLIIRLESRFQRHSKRFGSGISYIYERVEIPILLAGVLFGTVLAFITGAFASLILVPYAIVKSWPIITMFAPKLAAHLWQSTKDLPSSVITGVAEFIWPGSEPYTGTESGNTHTNSSQRHSDQTFFLSDGATDDRSSDEMEVMESASGSWKVSDTVETPEDRQNLTRDLRISSSPTRRHRRTGTGSSISLSGTSSPELIKTPLVVNTSRDSYHRRHRSGSSSPESYFRMTALQNIDRTQSASDLRRHCRSGSSSVASTRSQGGNRAPGGA